VTIDPKRFEGIWEVCPELRPEGLHILAYGGRLMGYSLEGHFEQMSSAPVFPDASMPISHAHAYALICYKIVWWLAKYRKDRGWGMLRILQSDTDICINVAENDECVCGPDPTGS